VDEVVVVVVVVDESVMGGELVIIPLAGPFFWLVANAKNKHSRNCLILK
jgi:hypothetical protein